MAITVTTTRTCNNCLYLNRIYKPRLKFRCVCTNDTVNPYGLACYFYEPRSIPDPEQVKPIDIYPRR